MFRSKLFIMPRSRKDLNFCEKWKLTETNTKMTQMLELPYKDLKTVIIKMF